MKWIHSENIGVRNVLFDFIATRKEMDFFIEIDKQSRSQKMAELSKTLLEDSGEMPLGAKISYCFRHAGQLSQKDYSGSYRLWLKHKPSVFGNKEPDLLFRLLAAESATGN
jgi:hypothetical protein